GRSCRRSFRRSQKSSVARSPHLPSARRSLRGRAFQPRSPSGPENAMPKLAHGRGMRGDLLARHTRILRTAQAKGMLPAPVLAVGVPAFLGERARNEPVLGTHGEQRDVAKIAAQVRKIA